MSHIKLAAAIFTLFFANSVDAAVSYTAVDCADSGGNFSGTTNVKTPANGFSIDDLKDIYLGEKQTPSAAMPYPADMVVAPVATDLQNLSLSVSGSPFGFGKAVFFVVRAKNFLQLNVLCTMTEHQGR